MEIISPAIALIGALLSGLFSAMAYASERRTKRGETQRLLSDQYDRLVRYRIEHPEVLPLSRRWRNTHIGLAYGQDSPEAREWATYYTYTELCIGYCNSVLYAKQRNLIDEVAYTAQHEPLVKLLITEHWPFFADLLVQRKYISSFIADYVDAQRKAGWDWLAEHRLIDSLPDSGERTDPHATV
jgi:hypothetical protein